MSFIVVGTNHKYSPIALRERISFSQKRLGDVLNFLSERDVLAGAVILSTCNRVEIYASTEEPEKGIREIEDFISRYHEIAGEIITPFLYKYKDKEAINHLFSVASGLDSLILGERQILQQVKFAFVQSGNVAFIDKSLEEIFYSAFYLAKKIHAETKISEGKVSVGSVAIDFIKQKLGSLQNKNILIIGVGKVTELVLNYLSKENPSVVFVSNRTFARARQLANRIGAESVRFDQLKQFLKVADVVISATASPHFVIKKETVEQTNNRKLLIIDLGLPRDVQPQVKELSGVELYCLEDLDTEIKRNKEKKLQEASKAKAIIDIEVERLWREVTKLEPEPVLLPLNR